MPMFFDSSFIYLIPAIIFAIYAQSKVKSTFAKFLKVRTQKGYTGYQVARTILNNNRLDNIKIEITPGKMSDHYDPRSRVLRLSNDVYHGSSIAAVSVAAHEVGHAVQHSVGYAPLGIRNAIFPIAKFTFVLIGIT